MHRLDSQTLAQLPTDVIKPSYDRDLIAAGIVHLGVGAFHRGHQAWYTEQVLRQQGGDWAIIGASLRSASVRNQMQPQQGLYSLVVRENDHDSIQVIGAIKQVLVAAEDPKALINQMADAAIKVITLTITEKGYCHNPATGSLDTDNPDIRKDIANFGAAPLTAIGYLVSALAARRANGANAVTVLSCDNLPHNGRLLQRVVGAFAEAVDPALATWIDSNVRFPCSMVDRIVPAVTEEDFSSLGDQLGVLDQAAVFTEPFHQWVIERNFASAVPDWESAGALYVDDVAPFEDMKLRLLNGSHSIIAYLGYMAGYDYVHEVMADKHFNRLVQNFMVREVIPTLSLSDDFDVQAYTDSLLTRFSNRALNHKTRQIAQDGSQKIPQRWLRAAELLLEQDKSVSIIALAIAGWIRFLEGCRDNGERFQIDDPVADHLTSLLLAVAAKQDAGKTVMAIMSEQSVFGDVAVRFPELVQQVVNEYRQLSKLGVRARVEAFE
jgi:fructuronate reductase